MEISASKNTEIALQKRIWLVLDKSRLLGIFLKDTSNKALPWLPSAKYAH